MDRLRFIDRVALTDFFGVLSPGIFVLGGIVLCILGLRGCVIIGGFG